MRAAARFCLVAVATMIVLLLMPNLASAAGSTVTFVGQDTTTGGTWEGVYGADGSVLANVTPQNVPSYATFQAQNQASYSWNSSTSDPRALETNSGTARIAACWYNGTTFNFDVNFTDGNTHQFALYALDWDQIGRTETVQIVDANTGNQLDLRTLSNFGSGAYLIWNISGHVKINVTSVGGSNAVVSGVFFGPVSTTPAAAATFLSEDTSTEGTWEGVYGADGSVLANVTPQNVPSYATFQVQNQGNCTWATNPSDTRAPQTGSGTARIAACWYSGTTFNFDVNFTDGNTHRFALYALDWDQIGRTETVQIVDANTGNQLDLRTLSNFGSGAYLMWNISGHVHINITNTGTVNAVASGVFFGPVSTTPAAAAAFLSEDTSTGGTWEGVYGADGSVLANVTPQNVPSYATFQAQNQASYSWNSSTSDPRALETNSGTARIAACWYNGTTFNFDVNFTDGNTHQFALYALDWDQIGRTETVQIVDANTGNQLDLRTLSNFGSGAYLIWNISGHVKINVTSVGGSNAVVSGVFFGPVSTTPAAAATFLSEDASTEGTWEGVYGADGSVLANVTPQNVPSYATFQAQNQASYSWNSSTSDPRALETGSGTARIAACWYNGTTFNFDVNFTDGNTHRFALYALDWDQIGRTETVQIVDANTGNQLDLRTLSNFGSGAYLIWNISGHVKINVTSVGGSNAVVSGVFFGPVSTTPAAAAAFLSEDTSTEGTWEGVYGADGSVLANVTPQNVPSYATFQVQNQGNCTWATNPSDTRAPQTGSGTARIAACWYSGTTFNFDVNFTDGNTHRFALYALDWDQIGRTETVQIVDANTGNQLDLRTLSNFGSGAYLVWNISGHVHINITNTGTVNAVASGVFFGPAHITITPAITSANSATFTVGTAGTFTVTATGTPPPTFSETGTLPAGVTLSSAGALSGTPGASTGGTYPITITAQNGVTPNATQNFSLTVDQGPTITSQNSATFAVGAAGTFTVTATGTPPPTFSETGALPTGVMLSSTGALSGTPSSGTQGTYPITITAHNGVGSNFLQSFTLTVTAPLPTVQISVPGPPPLQAGGTARTFTITVANDKSGDLPSVTSFALGGVGCMPSTCGSFGAVTGTAGSGSYSILYTPPTSLTAAVSPTVTVSPSLPGQWFAATTSFTVNPAGVILSQSVTGGPLNGAIVQVSSGVRTLTYTVYNDIGNAGATVSLTAGGYACQNLSLNSCGTLGTPVTMAVNSTTTTTTVTYKPPTSLPTEPYDRPRIQATSVADPTEFANTGFLLSYATTSLISYSQKFDSALTGAAPISVSAGFTDTTTAKSANWTLAANGTACAPSTCGTLGTPTVTTNGNSVTSTVTYTPPASVPTGPDQNFPTITATMTANPAVQDSFSFNIVDGTCGTGNNGVLSGNYAFLMRGGAANSGYSAIVGSFTADGNGNITGGLEDINRSTGVLTGLTLTGSYSIGADNRGCLTLTNSNGGTGTFRVALGTISSTTATQGTITASSDTTGQGARMTGILKQQNLTNVTSSTVSGTYAFGREGVDSSGNRFAVAGLATSNGAGTLSGITFDFDDNGSIGTISGGSGSYSLATNAPSGRGTAQTTISAVTANFVLYVVSPSDLFVMSTDLAADANHPIQSGENKLQTGTFSTSGLTSGSGYVFYGSGIDNSNGGSTTALGQAEFTNSSGAATVTTDENDNGISQTEQSGPATFTVASNGRMTGTGLGLGSNPPVIYLVDSTQGFMVGTDHSVASGYTQQQTLSSFSTSTISGQFFFGGGSSTIGSTFDSGIISFTPANPSGAVNGIDDSSGPNYTVGCGQGCGGAGLAPNSSISGPYTFSTAPTAPGQGTVGGGTLAYIISPSNLVLMQTGTSQNTNPAEIFVLQQ